MRTTGTTQVKEMDTGPVTTKGVIPLVRGKQLRRAHLGAEPEMEILTELPGKDQGDGQEEGHFTVTQNLWSPRLMPPQDIMAKKDLTAIREEVISQQEQLKSYEDIVQNLSQQLQEVKARIEAEAVQARDEREQTLALARSYQEEIAQLREIMAQVDRRSLLKKFLGLP